MVPLAVSSVSVFILPPLPVQFCFLGVFEWIWVNFLSVSLSKQVISKKIRNLSLRSW
jgi:hypothetical protein